MRVLAAFAAGALVVLVAQVMGAAVQSSSTVSVSCNADGTMNLNVARKP